MALLTARPYHAADAYDPQPLIPRLEAAFIWCPGEDSSLKVTRWKHGKILAASPRVAQARHGDLGGAQHRRATPVEKDELALMVRAGRKTSFWARLIEPGTDFCRTFPLPPTFTPAQDVAVPERLWNLCGYKDCLRTPAPRRGEPPKPEVRTKGASRDAPVCGWHSDVSPTPMRSSPTIGLIGSKRATYVRMLIREEPFVSGADVLVDAAKRMGDVRLRVSRKQ